MHPVEIRLQSRVLLLGKPGAFSHAVRHASDTTSLGSALAEVARSNVAVATLRREWREIASTALPSNTRDDELLALLARQIRANAITAVLLDPTRDRVAVTPVQTAAAPVARMSESDKVAAALLRCIPMVGKDVGDALKEMLQPANIAIMVGVFVGLALAQLYPPAGAAIDAAVLLIAAWTVGWEGTKAVTKLVEATAKAMSANSDAEINQAAGVYAAAFEALGAAAIAALTARFVKKKIGAAAEETEGAAASGQPQRRTQPPRDAKAAAQQPQASPAAKPVKLRDKYMGRTPGKGSRTGQEVIERMREDGTLRTNARSGKTIFKASDGNWYPLEEADMAHRTDAVTWWNQTGRQYGAKSPQVREFMLDSDNYVLDHFSLNRSAGARLGQTQGYLPPLTGN